MSKPRRYLVYKLVNQINGKVYVGITSKTMETRLRCHIFRAQTGWKEAIYCAMRKYGISNFFVIVVDDSATSYEELLKKEREYIKLFNTYIDDGQGYNMTRGGEGSLGRKMSQEQKEKFSKKMTGRKYSEEHKKRISERTKGEKNPRYGTKWSPELREKIMTAMARGWQEKAAREGWTLGVTKRIQKYRRRLGSRESRKIEFKGQRKSIKEWSKETGIGEAAIWRRLKKYGWTIERTLTEKDGKQANAIKYEWNGKSQSLPKWAEEYGLPYQFVFSRVTVLGWSLEQALTAPNTKAASMVTYQGQTKTKTEWAKDLGISIQALSYRLKNWPIEKAFAIPLNAGKRIKEPKKAEKKEDRIPTKFTFEKS